jgi:hypothetical protein
VQLGGMAVNHTGNGGVAKGTVYAATRIDGNTYVSVYEPVGEAGKRRLKSITRFGSGRGPLLALRRSVRRTVSPID